MIAKCRLHTDVFPSTTGYDIGCTVAHFKTLGTTQLWYSMEDEFDGNTRMTFCRGKSDLHMQPVS